MAPLEKLQRARPVAKSDTTDTRRIFVHGSGWENMHQFDCVIKPHSY